ncbi:pancreatic progenitor cell differentiation and proliferation factor A [Pseudoliparis swirei]|uniref:pancreatic progenitor cell differentiation and proliferation factor A n=1 Tax=Pseudoliparis swirei TaxID=2059687 RepID=UPI0024BD9B96|nr:pancreatic progenitor cell differentiation and proliferation factor A [Pseudoliparis swirei]
MAAIPSTGSLIATHDYYRRRLGSNSSNSSCGSAEYTGEVIPHPPGLPRQDSGHWWSSFFFAKQNPAGMQNGSETQKDSTYTLADGQVTCIVKEMVLNRKLSVSSDTRKLSVSSDTRKLSVSSDTGKSETSDPPPASS